MKTPTIGKYEDQEEKELIESVEKKDFKIKSFLTEERKKEVQEIASSTMNKKEREKISLRVPKDELSRIKSKAMQEGISYQSLINSIIHKFNIKNYGN
jgi:predicted DNA binding CopG/RHH family protein